MIVLLTDFGNSEYVGVMKGVILAIAKNAEIIDLYHDIKPQKVKQAAWILLKNYKLFPRNTIFLCVVDPGVGSKRQAVIVKTTNYTFIGPDNGLLWPAVIEDGIKIVIKLPIEGASKTFHGRDVFAKAAGELESGKSLLELKETKLKERLSFHLKEREGEVVHIDHFGNIITNLPALNKKEYEVNERKIKYYETYDEAPENELFLITGSSKTLEISLKGKSAIEIFKLNIGNKITIK